MTLLKLAVLLSTFAVVLTDGTIRVCYYSNWSQYRPGAGKFLPKDIDPFLCTHVIYSFSKLDHNHELTFYEWNDDKLYAQFNNINDTSSLKHQNPNLKTLLATGGWNAGSKVYSDMVTDVALRKKFARTSVDFLRHWGFDGLDLDWEYPALRGGRPEDKGNFIELFKDLKEQIDKDESDNPGKSRLLLTAAVAAGKSNIDVAYDIPGMAMYLDFINLMSYDLHGGWEGFTGHNSPLYRRSSESGTEITLNIDWAARYWVDGGTPKEKLIIGLATYGRSFELSDTRNFRMGAPAAGAGTAGAYTREKGFLAYYEVCQMLAAGATRYWDAEHKIPYLVKGNQWVGYDDEESFTVKLQYILDNGYGGAMVWNIDLDDFSRQCPQSKRRYPLMSLMAEILGGYTPPSTHKHPVPTTSEIKTTRTPIVTDATNSYGGALRVCYYSNWSQYRPGAGKFLPKDIDPFLCTHFIYSFSKLDHNHELTFYEWNDDKLYAQFNDINDVSSLKHQNPNLKTLLATGGWNAGSKVYSDMVTDVALRKKFARTSVDFLRHWGFDGLDLDWEYPALRGGRPEDKENFIELLKDLKEQIDKDESDNPGKSRLLLTAAVAAGKSNIDAAYDIPGMAMYLDFINLMSYDLHGGWEGFTGHNSPLYRRSSESGTEITLNIDWAAKYWVDGGTPKEKLIIGLATYGRSFELSDTRNFRMGAPAAGAGTAGAYTREKGFLAYYEVCQMLAAGAKRYWDAEHKIPYLVKGNQWVGYDDEESFTVKLQYILDNGYGGAMVWNIDLDDFSRQCPQSKRRYPLMSLMEEILGDHTPPSTDRSILTDATTSHGDMINILLLHLSLMWHLVAPNYA